MKNAKNMTNPSTTKSIWYLQSKVNGHRFSFAAGGRVYTMEHCSSNALFDNEGAAHTAAAILNEFCDLQFEVILHQAQN